MPPESDPGFTAPTPDGDDALGWLYQRQRFGIRPGLERTEALLSALGDPQRHFDAVLIGGTNGKGSTVATLASILRADDRSVGAFISPHLHRLTERIVLNGEPLATARLVEQLQLLRGAAERSGATFFEILFAVACRVFATAEIELAVIEVGLGGRYDASNVLSPLLSIITGVDLDHREVLGDTVARIAADKAGILRPGRPALTGAQGVALEVIEAQARTLGAPLSVLGRDIEVTGRPHGLQGSQLQIALAGGTLEVITPLAGRHQFGNVALAVAAADLLGVPDPSVQTGVAGTQWPGRLEPLDWFGRRLLVDGAHNPAAARALARALAELEPGPIALVMGVSREKDAAGIAAELAPLAALLVATQASSSGRAVAARALAEAIGAGAWHPDPASAIDLAAQAAPEATLVVAGSLFLVAEVRALALGIEAEGVERLQ